MSKLKLSSNVSGSGNVTLTSPNTNSDFTVEVPSGNGAMPLMKLETAKSAVGTAVDFTGIPSWVKRITVMFDGVSTSGASSVQIQAGTTSGFATTGYSCSGAIVAIGISGYTTGFGIESVGNANAIRSGAVVIQKLSGNAYIENGVIARTDTTLRSMLLSGGSVTLSDTLTQIRITTVNGTDTFDAGSFNILLEG